MDMFLQKRAHTSNFAEWKTDLFEIADKRCEALIVPSQEAARAGLEEAVEAAMADIGGKFEKVSDITVCTCSGRCTSV